ncbi:MAG: PEP-CTERM sorting domain-containing protein [Myxococcales bacterium]|nr:PEP-CTERM sorting domain-containing protein [Myxococcales bacterium]
MRALQHLVACARILVPEPRVQLSSSHEFDDNYHQTANLIAAFDVGSPLEVFLWESDPTSPDFKDDAVDERVDLDIPVPAGATEVVLTFGFFDAGNDWWWAIDNIGVDGEVPEPNASLMLVVGAGVLLLRQRFRSGRR